MEDLRKHLQCLALPSHMGLPHSIFIIYELTPTKGPDYHTNQRDKPSLQSLEYADWALHPTLL